MKARITSIGLLLLVWCVASGTAAVMAEPQQPPAAEPQQPPAAEALTLHGWWSIEVREPDGTPVRRTEFENALIRLSGDFALAQLLSGQISLSAWSVTLDDGTGQPRQIMLSSFHPRTTTEPILNVNVITFGPFSDDAHLQLQGTGVSPATQTLRQVSSFVSGCTPPEAPTVAGCAGGTSAGGTFGYSLAQLPQPVDVLQGQQVLVTITFSFS